LPGCTIFFLLSLGYTAETARSKIFQARTAHSLQHPAHYPPEDLGHLFFSKPELKNKILNQPCRHGIGLLLIPPNKAPIPPKLKYETLYCVNQWSFCQF